MRSVFRPAKGFIALLFGACMMHGAPVSVSSYEMENGQTGNFIYQDTTYLPCPGASCTTTGALLTGGTGRLTDGIAAPFSWDGSGQPFGTAIPWVGWSGGSRTITFNFSGLPTVSRVGLYLDNTPGTGDVRLPDSVDIAAVNYDVTADATFGPRWIYFDIPNTTGNSLVVTLNSDAGRWMMIGEATFDDGFRSGVPEPGSMALLVSGLGALAYRRFRKAA